MVRLLDDTLIRVGNEEYAVANDSYGLTTLRPEHVEEVGRTAFSFRFVGKSGVEHDVTVRDPKLARLVRRCQDLDGQVLFSYRDEVGAVASVSSGDVNEYLRRHVGPHTTAKDFRTWGASSLVTNALGPLDSPEGDKQAEGHIVEAIDAAAEQLRNTPRGVPPVLRPPSVLDAYRDGSLHETWNHARSAGQLDRADRTLLQTLRVE